MKTIVLTRNYSVNDLMDVSVLSPSQINALNYGSIVRLRTDLTYVVCPQWVHTSKLARSVNGYNQSNKVLLLGVNDDGVPEGVFDMAISSLTKRYYAEVEKDETGKPKPLFIKATKNEEGLYRAPGVQQSPVFAKGVFPLRTDGSSRAYVYSDFAFKITRRLSVYDAQFKQNNKKKWDMLVNTIDGSTYLDLTISYPYEFEQVTQIPSLNWDELVPELARYRQNLP